MFKNYRGFALIELIIVLVVIILLAAMTIPIFKKLNETNVSTTEEVEAAKMEENPDKP